MAILLLAFLCLTATAFAGKIHSDSLEISKRPIELSDDELLAEISKRPIDLFDDSLEISKRPIELSDDELLAEISKQPIDLSHESLEPSEEQFRAPIFDTGLWPGSFQPLDDGVTSVCNQFGIYRAPDPTSCSRFYLCNNGFGTLQNCDHGLHFNVQANGCIDRNIADCDLCRYNTLPVRLLPFEGSCTRYIVCTGTQRTERECADGLYFNPAISKCDRKENVVCSIDDGNQPLTCPNNNQLYTVPSITRCEEYFQCLNGVVSHIACGQGDIFDLNTQQCRNTGRCILDVNPVCRAGDRFLPHPFDCRHFFTCQNGLATLHSCRIGELFDRPFLRCVPERDARCGNPDFGTGPNWPGFGF